MKFVRWLVGKILLFLDALFSPKSVVRGPDAQKKVQAALDGLSIYEFQACPFCVKVRRHLKREGISVPLRDAKRDPFQSELLKGGGKLQVPCLRIEGEGGSVAWLYESSDIIAYLKQRVAAASE